MVHKFENIEFGASGEVTLRAKMVVMSHLSDASDLVSMGGDAAEIRNEINFAKWIIMHYNLDAMIDADAVYKEFIEKFINKRS